MSSHNEEIKQPTTTANHKADVLHDENAMVQADHQTTAWQSMKQNPKILLWTLYANLASLMLGYENLALSVCLAMPAFQKTFATMTPAGPIIPAEWQSAWNAVFNVMGIFGSIGAGFVQDWFGRRTVFLCVILLGAAGIAVAFVAHTPAEFLGGKILTGLAINAGVTVCQTYVSEIAPLPMRGIALSMNTILMNLGMLIAISTTFSRISIMDESAFRVVFAAAWIFPGLLACGLPFLPESPYWLVQKNKIEAAHQSLARLSNGKENIEIRLAQIQEAVDTERALSSSTEGASFAECFRGTNLRRTLILCLCIYMPNIIGATLSGNAPYFLNQTGMDSHTVVMLIQVGISIGVISAILNIFLMMKFHHRILIFFGVGACIIFYLVMGVAGTQERTPSNLLIIGVCIVFLSVSYGPAVAPAMAIVGEVSSTKLRSKSIGVGQAFAAVTGTIWTVVLPYLFNSDQANLGGNVGWIWLGQGIIYIVVVYFYVPGTKGRTFIELDMMFSKKIPARRFESYKIDESESEI